MSVHTALQEKALWDESLFKKYDVQGPRYTSYPTALQFHPFNYSDYQQAASHLKDSIAPLSLYLHIPFCQNICYYCACNKVITKDTSVTSEYLDHLFKEMEMQAELVGKHRTVMQLHFGGGTPTFLSDAELTEAMHHLASCFHLTDSDKREYSIELDPRTVSPQRLALLKGLGFNRVSLGVQDFNPEVQQAVNRIQSEESVRELTEAARRYQFKSISFDLIYGLPHQTPETLNATLDQVLDISPDRIAFYNYAHLPERFLPQRAIDRLTLPSAEQKLAMLGMITEKLQSAGYAYIGMDHFVKPDDDLAILQEQGRLQRNFQGYSTCLAPDLIGMGVSAISSLENAYAQNVKTVDEYYALIEDGQLPIEKGLVLNEDDHIRRDVIMQLICNLMLDPETIEEKYDIDFETYFAPELEQLDDFVADHLVERDDNIISITAEGRAMLRNICMTFDAHLNPEHANRFSKTL